METKELLLPLNLSSSWYYSIEPKATFLISQAMIKEEKIDNENDRSGNPSSLGSLFSASELLLREERDIWLQIVRCVKHGYLVNKILDYLDPNWDNLCLTQRQIKAFIRAYGEKIISILKIEEPKLPSHLLFLGKNNGRYWLTSANLKENKFTYVVFSFRASPGISQYGFLVLPRNCL